MGLLFLRRRDRPILLLTWVIKYVRFPEQLNTRQIGLLRFCHTGCGALRCGVLRYAAKTTQYAATHRIRCERTFKDWLGQKVRRWNTTIATTNRLLHLL